MMPNTIQKLTVSLFHLTCDIDDQFPSAPHWGTSHAVDVQDEARPLMPMTLAVTAIFKAGKAHTGTVLYCSTGCIRTVQLSPASPAAPACVHHDNSRFQTDVA
jgi:hypothetical protein